MKTYKEVVDMLGKYRARMYFDGVSDTRLANDLITAVAFIYDLTEDRVLDDAFVAFDRIVEFEEGKANV